MRSVQRSDPANGNPASASIRSPNARYLANGWPATVAPDSAIAVAVRPNAS